MSDFRVELNISANYNGTYCYCESQENLANGRVDTIDFSEGDFWDVIQEKIRNFVKNDKQFVKACKILDKEGKLILTVEY